MYLRHKNVHVSQRRKFLGVFVVSFLVTTVSYSMPAIWGGLHPPSQGHGEVDRAGEALFLNKIDLATFTYGGLSFLSGLFVPSLLSGAAFGASAATSTRLTQHPRAFANESCYALMGSAAFPGRDGSVIISLTVILILEATGNGEHSLPASALMITLMCARLMGNMFNEGLFDVHINLKKILSMQQEAPEVCDAVDLTAGKAMSRDVKCVRQVECASGCCRSSRGRPSGRTSGRCSGRGR